MVTLFQISLKDYRQLIWKAVDAYPHDVPLMKKYLDAGSSSIFALKTHLAEKTEGGNFIFKPLS